MSSVLPTPTPYTVGTMTIPAPDDPVHEHDFQLQKLQLAQMDKPSLEIKCLDLIKQISKLEESKARNIMEKCQFEKELTEKDANERQLNKQIGLLELAIANKVGQGKGRENSGIGPFVSNGGGFGTSRMLFAPDAGPTGPFGSIGVNLGCLPPGAAVVYGYDSAGSIHLRGILRPSLAGAGGFFDSIGRLNIGSLPPGTLVACYGYDSAGSIRPLGIPGTSVAGTAGPTAVDKGSGSLSHSELASASYAKGGENAGAGGTGPFSSIGGFNLGSLPPGISIPCYDCSTGSIRPLGIPGTSLASAGGSFGSIGGLNIGSLPPGTSIACYDPSTGSFRPLGIPGTSLAGTGPYGVDNGSGSLSLSEPASASYGLKADVIGKPKAKPKGPNQKPVTVPVAPPKKQPKAKAKAKPKAMWGLVLKEPKRFRCVDCPKEYATKKAYFNHVRMHLEKDNKTNK